MARLAIPNSFSPGTTASSSQVDANFNAISTWANGGIDASNINTSSGSTPGLYASQLLPTSSAQGTFTTTTTGVGYTFLGGDKTAVPLSIAGVSSQTADLLDVALVSAGTITFKVDKIGQGIFSAGAAGSVPLTINGISGQTADLLDAYLTSGGTQLLSFTKAGALAIAPTINSVNTLGYVPPVYTNAGVSLGGTLHIITGTAMAVPSGASGSTINLTGAAVFTSGSTYQVFVTCNAGDGTGPASASNLTATSFNVTQNTGFPANLFWIAIGT